MENYRAFYLSEKFGVSVETIKFIRAKNNIPFKMTQDEANFVMSKTRIFKYRIGYNSIDVMEKLLFQWSPSLIAKELKTSKARVLDVLEEWENNDNTITIESKINFMV